MKTTLTLHKASLLDVSLSSLLKALFLFFLFSLSLNTVYANESSSEDNCVYGICESAGEIGNEQIIVRGTVPAELTETKRPRCEPGELEYMWMYYSSSSGGWQHIPNSNSKTYQPGELFRTTYFLRCVRKKGCPTYRESNIIRIEVVDCMPSGIEHEEACLNDPIDFSAQTVYSTNDVIYRWTFEDGSPSSSTDQHVSVTWSTEGLKKITLTVIDGQCENTYEEEVYVINCDCKGFYCRVNTSANCGTGMAWASGQGGVQPYTYRWSTGASSRSISRVASGDYSVTVTDANGCECVRYFSIAGPSDVGCNITKQKNLSRCGASDGYAEVIGTGGSGRYFYTWSNGQIGRRAFGLSAGTYSVTVRDLGSGCTSVCEVEIEEPDNFDIVTLLTSGNCNDNGTLYSIDDCEGQVVATLSRVAPDCRYTFSHSVNSGPFNFGSVAENLCSGDKVVFRVVENCTGCVKMSNEVMVPEELESSIERTPDDCLGGPGEFKVTVSGGTPPYSYTLPDPIGAGVIPEDGGMITFSAGVVPLTFNFRATDRNGCETLASPPFVPPLNGFDVEFNELFPSCTSQSVPNGCNAVVEANVVTDTPCPDGYTYEWIDQGVNSPEIRTLCGNTQYCVRVTSNCNPDCAVFRCFETSPTSDFCNQLASCSIVATRPICGDPDQSVPIELNWNGDGNASSFYNYSFEGPDGIIFQGTFASGEGPFTQFETGVLGETYTFTLSATDVMNFGCSVSAIISECSEPDTDNERRYQNLSNPIKVFAEKTMVDGIVREQYDSNSSPTPNTVDNNIITSVAKVFPNPFHENVNILLENEDLPFGKLLEVEVMNIAGQLLQRQLIDSSTSQLEINMADQASGVYFIRLSGEGIEPEVHKVVKK